MKKRKHSASASVSPASAGEILSDLRPLREHVDTDTLFSESAAGQTDETLGAVRERLETAQKNVAELYASAKQKVLAGAKSTDRTVRRHPYPSLAVAAGIGLLAGLLLSRRGK